MNNKLSKLAVYSYLIDAVYIEEKIFELEGIELGISQCNVEDSVFDKNKIFEYYIELYESGKEKEVKEVIEYIENMHMENHYNNYIDLGINYKWRALWITYSLK